jgi:formamidopyrimidine-DNA glycosylase
MPELPEVETVRRMIEARVRGRVVAEARRSRARLHVSSRSSGLAALRGRTLDSVDRRGKYLLLGFGDVTLLSHLGMSGRWLFFEDAPARAMPHVHARLEFEDGSALWFQDPRRFGQLRVVAASGIERDLSLRKLGRDPLDPPLTEGELAKLAKGARVAVKVFLLDQARIAGIGNIYASEILFRARVHPARRAGSLGVGEWRRIAVEIPAVLQESIDRMGTTFSSYRTIWNEPGAYGDQLRVYDRAGEPCRRCGNAIRRVIQGQRSTFYCPTCQRQARRISQSARS